MKLAFSLSYFVSSGINESLQESILMKLFIWKYYIKLPILIVSGTKYNRLRLKYYLNILKLSWEEQVTRKLPVFITCK